MDTRKTLKNMLDLVHRDLIMDRIDFNAFINDQSIFIIKSASMNTLQNFIGQIQRMNPRISFEILAPSRDKNEILNVCDNHCHFIEYPAQGAYDISKLQELIPPIKTRNNDKYVMLYNNRDGLGYENIIEILTAITKDCLYVFNSYDELYRMENPQLYRNSLMLLTSVSEWFWEHAEERL